MGTSRTLFFAFIVGMSPSAFGHGMDKPGPHWGYIRMPGTFHTEIVMNGENTFLLYLLDDNFKNSLVKNSSVEVIMKREAKENALTCKTNQDHFRCEINGNLTFQNGDEIRIRAKRLGISGGVAIYRLPLKLLK